MFLALTGCFGPPATDSAPAFQDVPVEITAVDWACDADDDTWTFVVETTGWTSGGLVAMSDASRVEAHPMLSVEAAPDGTWDRLELELDIAADPRDAEDGKISGWLCDAPTLDALAFRLSVNTRGGETADCRVWGQDVDWSALAGYSHCAERLAD